MIEKTYPPPPAMPSLRPGLIGERPERGYGGRSAAKNRCPIAREARMRFGLSEPRPGEDARGHRKIAEPTQCALQNEPSQTKRRPARLECGHGSIDSGIGTLHGRKEKNREDADNCQHNQFASDAAMNHRRITIIPQVSHPSSHNAGSRPHQMRRRRCYSGNKNRVFAFNLTDRNRGVTDPAPEISTALGFTALAGSRDFSLAVGHHGGAGRGLWYRFRHLGNEPPPRVSETPRPASGCRAPRTVSGPNSRSALACVA